MRQFHIRSGVGEGRILVAAGPLARSVSWLGRSDRYPFSDVLLFPFELLDFVIKYFRTSFLTSFNCLFALNNMLKQ